MSEDDLRWLRERAAEAERRTAERLARARDEAQRSGKERFSYDRLLELHDPSSDLGHEVRDPAEAAARLERKYYLDFPEVRTIAEFAERLNDLRAHG